MKIAPHISARHAILSSYVQIENLLLQENVLTDISSCTHILLYSRLISTHSL